MSHFTDDLRKRIEEEEIRNVLVEFEQAFAIEGVVPRTDLLPLRRHRRKLETAAEIILGVLSASVALLLTFAVFNMWLHIEFLI